MNEHNSELKLQAYLDQELSNAESAEVARLLAGDKRAQALMGEMSFVRSALADYARREVKVPVSREFYWSSIRRQIEQAESRGSSVTNEPVSWLTLLQRFLVPAGALAALIIAGLFTATQTGMFNSSRVTRLESALASPGSFTYRDFGSGTTLVWLSYPAEKTFADYDEDSTMP